MSKFDNETDEERLERFLSHVNKTADCWLWTGAKNGNNGYGVFSIKHTLVFAHRFSYSSLVGEIQRGYIICHACDNPSCVNPSHLWPGTHKDNTRDCISKGRFGHKYFSNVQLKLSRKDVNWIKSNYKKGFLRQKDIAKKYSVDQRTISRIVRGESYLFFEKE